MSKATKKQLTPKQTVIRASKLLKGIDNSVLQIQKHQASIDSNTSELKSLVNGLGTPPAAKPAKKVKEAKAKPPKAAKPPKPAKKAKEAKAASKSNGASKIKPPVDGRPSLKQAIQEVLANGPLQAADIWKAATGKYGYWSRQSLYTALKDTKTFVNVNKKFQLAAVKPNEQVEAFVEKVASDTATAKVV